MGAGEKVQCAAPEQRSHAMVTTTAYVVVSLIRRHKTR